MLAATTEQRELPLKIRITSYNVCYTKLLRRMAFWLVVLLLCVLIGILCFSISYNYVMQNYRNSINKEDVVVNESEAVEFFIERGSNTTKIAEALMDQGLIKNEGIFRITSYNVCYTKLLRSITG